MEPLLSLLSAPAPRPPLPCTAGSLRPPSSPSPPAKVKPRVGRGGKAGKGSGRLRRMRGGKAGGGRWEPPPRAQGFSRRLRLVLGDLLAAAAPPREGKARVRTGVKASPAGRRGGGLAGTSAEGRRPRAEGGPGGSCRRLSLSPPARRRQGGIPRGPPSHRRGHRPILPRTQQQRGRGGPLMLPTPRPPAPPAGQNEGCLPKLRPGGSQRLSSLLPFPSRRAEPSQSSP